MRPWLQLLEGGAALAQALSNRDHSKPTRAGAGAHGQVCAQVQPGRRSGTKSKCRRHRLLRSPCPHSFHTRGRTPARRPGFSSVTPVCRGAVGGRGHRAFQLPRLFLRLSKLHHSVSDARRSAQLSVQQGS